MARPQSVTDEEILGAAAQVIGRRGYEGFTLAEVAGNVGLSRAAIILRFKSTRELRLRLATHQSERFEKRIAAIPVSRSGDALLDFAEYIGKWIASHDKFANFMTVFRENIQDKELAVIERERGETLHRAIAARMPKTVLDTESATLSFRAQLSGAMMQWEVETGVSPSDYLAARTQDWLTLAGITFTRRVAAGKSPKKSARAKIVGA
jgi:TetR/AcrR family macrolide resistance operon transcriptional repressor